MEMHKTKSKGKILKVMMNLYSQVTFLISAYFIHFLEFYSIIREKKRV